MNFYLFKLKVSDDASDEFPYHQRNGIITAESMEEALEVINRNYMEDPYRDVAITIQIVFFSNTDDNICYVDAPKYDRLKEFFDRG